jgi:hypothetical protein
MILVQSRHLSCSRDPYSPTVVSCCFFFVGACLRRQHQFLYWSFLHVADGGAKTVLLLVTAMRLERRSPSILDSGVTGAGVDLPSHRLLSCWVCLFFHGCRQSWQRSSWRLDAQLRFLASNELTTILKPVSQLLTHSCNKRWPLLYQSCILVSSVPPVAHSLVSLSQSRTQAADPR